MKFKSLIIILLTFVVNVSAQNMTSFADMNYKDEVRTVMLHPTESDLDKPVVFIYQMRNRLHLQFDILADEAPYLYYTFIHCDNSWQPTDLQKNDYIKGYFQGFLCVFRQRKQLNIRLFNCFIFC